MRFEEFEKLYKKAVSGNASLEEQKLFEQFKDDFDLVDIPWAEEMGNILHTKSKLVKDLNKRIAKDNRKTFKLWYLPIAASLLVAFGLAMFLYKSGRTVKSINQLSAAQAKIKPGKDIAILITSGGSRLALNGTKDSKIEAESIDGIQIDDNNRLKYQTDDKSVDGKMLFNTLVTPRGGQYQLILSDGTKVWLNAESTLKYPVSFVGRERLVELMGEAYFEVAKNKQKPFKVKTGDKNIEVLGTHFNVYAYPNEGYRATLLEGSVKINASGFNALLSPGEQGSITSIGKIDVSKVNVNDVVAWKDGVFVFNNDDIHKVMQQIARWYNVEVDYEGNVSNKKLGGTVSRYANIDDLLKTIELTKNVHFRIEGRRIIVMP